MKSVLEKYSEKFNSYLPPGVLFVLYFIFCPHVDVSTAESRKIGGVTEIWTVINVLFEHFFVVRSDRPTEIKHSC